MSFARCAGRDGSRRRVHSERAQRLDGLRGVRPPLFGIVGLQAADEVSFEVSRPHSLIQDDIGSDFGAHSGNVIDANRLLEVQSSPDICQRAVMSVVWTPTSLVAEGVPTSRTWPSWTHWRISAVLVDTFEDGHRNGGFLPRWPRWPTFLSWTPWFSRGHLEAGSRPTRRPFPTSSQQPRSCPWRGRTVRQASQCAAR